ncbi:MAG: chromosomal replication initiator protein DnaA [Armatimonadetes bacterium CG07_land_8_20_14_0_80_40_9]|nr:MAG: chromosomal replication initiator protein DnaA [Armatimonadetes bacterium CG07_land_8_20_14_0_80_40_9]
MEEQLQEVWQETLEVMKSRLKKPSFETWLKTIKPIRLEGSILTIQTPNEFARDWLEKRNYPHLIKEIIGGLLGKEIEISFTSSPKLEKEHFRSSPNLGEDLSRSSSLNPKYTFEVFVVGNCNRLCHAACLAVAGSPAKAYNPLFLYGGVGLGKTHLMQAIGHYVLSHHKRLKVYYATSERFTNEFIDSIKNHTTSDFQSRYRGVDVLLVDDIQFLIGKEQTQEEFFHTFNTLHESNKQIVISSDRPPKEFTALEERLKSRIGWGLIADIQAPDFETRIAILKKKSEIERVSIPEEVILYIAREIPFNIRDLEAALNKVIAYTSSPISKEPLTTTLVSEILKDILPSTSKKQVSILKIKEVVADYFNLKVSELTSPRRVKSLVYPRQISMYLCRELTDSSFLDIGENFGGRDHTTVMHAYDKISKEIKKRPDLEKDIESLIKQLK